mmetsp:Transcript_2476/g.7391  ORF Transcript_2476/g.7391 Transcript_2476/m.7391 type:complete len:238 (-) Transcript_2476:422-1135(-)
MLCRGSGADTTSISCLQLSQCRRRRTPRACTCKGPSPAEKVLRWIFKVDPTVASSSFATDYFSSLILGRHLRQLWSLRSCDEIVATQNCKEVHAALQETGVAALWQHLNHASLYELSQALRLLHGIEHAVSPACNDESGHVELLEVLFGNFRIPHETQTVNCRFQRYFVYVDGRKGQERASRHVLCGQLLGVCEKAPKYDRGERIQKLAGTIHLEDRQKRRPVPQQRGSLERRGGID